MESAASVPAQTEQSPLNVEKVEKQELGMELIRQKSQEVSSRVEELKEKVQKPAITTSLLVHLALNVTMLIVGAVTNKDCPIKPIIPIYLIVAGLLGMFTKVIPLVNMKLSNAILERIVYLLFLVEFIWMILGSVWIYSIYEPPYTPVTDQPHCNKTAYLLAFWLLTINYIFLLLMILIPCCIVCCFCICAACVASRVDD